MTDKVVKNPLISPASLEVENGFEVSLRPRAEGTGIALESDERIRCQRGGDGEESCGGQDHVPHDCWRTLCLGLGLCLSLRLSRSSCGLEVEEWTTCPFALTGSEEGARRGSCVGVVLSSRRWGARASLPALAFSLTPALGSCGRGTPRFLLPGAGVSVWAVLDGALTVVSVFKTELLTFRLALAFAASLGWDGLRVSEHL